MDIVLLIFCAIIGYALGSVNSSVIAGRLHGIDIRTQGSKNAGLTNTIRVLGKKAALMVLAGDILKGVASVLIGLLFARWSSGAVGAYYAVTAGTFAVLGHNWPVYFGFKGGKGILTTATVIFMLDYRIGLSVLVLFIIIVALTRFVSLGSVSGAVAVPFAAMIFRHDVVFVLFMVFLSILAIYRHRTNIKRLIAGIENKLGFKKGKEGSDGNERA